ncbi:hypothetical protein KZX46_09880 [Polymorphobacter sp. PAMC 29334]|uniref:hypothetical protein n=1 Tax=Polymorphobacter sp. PAMC 29334 TaxID=2862331 RepID=UPI001C799558|nr:hypothetical protein [Polymorphobacter sp. PAMC 29334]QYE36207.1 hypothetical protein KZX46_09880 [Polymorphobacter sp. PAMC 29334]
MRSSTRRGVFAAAILGATAVFAQALPPNRWGYDFASSYDAEVAAPAVHRVHYADDHIMLMEVGNPPGYAMQMHGHPYPSIFARSSGRTNLGGGGPGDQYLEPAGGRNGEHWHSALAPKGTPSLECTAADPQAPHRPVNHGVAPQHFYRIEYKRIDDDGPMAPKGRSAPVDRKIYEDDAIRLFEVSVPAGGSGNTTPTLYPAVLAIDSARAFDALDAVAGAGAGRSLPPTGLSMPRCMTVDAGTPLAVRNTGDRPIHYYRIEFKRIEGDALKDHWREWYPAMAAMQ